MSIWYVGKPIFQWMVVRRTKQTFSSMWTSKSGWEVCIELLCTKTKNKSCITALNASFINQVPTEKMLATLLIKIKHMTTSQPLAHVSVDPRNDKASTPNHFLIVSLFGHHCLQTERYETEVLNPRKTFEIMQNLACALWWIISDICRETRTHLTVVKPAPVNYDVGKICSKWFYCGLFKIAVTFLRLEIRKIVVEKFPHGVVGCCSTLTHEHPRNRHNLFRVKIPRFA